MDVGTPLVIEDPPTSPAIVNMRPLSIAGSTTPDQYWNNCDAFSRSNIYRPCHARTTSRQNHDALGEQAIFALRQPQNKIDFMQVCNSRRQAVIDNYERMMQADYEARQGLLARAFRSGLEGDWLVFVLQSGGCDRSTLGVHPVKGFRIFSKDRLHLEDIYSTFYPVNKQKRRSMEVKPFIADNLVDERRLLRYLKIPDEGVKELVLQDLFDLDAATCGKNTSMEKEGEAVESPDKSKDDTPMRESLSVECKSQDGEKKAGDEMEE